MQPCFADLSEQWRRELKFDDSNNDNTSIRVGFEGKILWLDGGLLLAERESITTV